MKAKNILWQETVKPVVVLLLICLISGLVLAAALAVTSLAACEQRLLTAEEAMDALEEALGMIG